LGLTREFYPSRTTEASRRLLEEIREIAKRTGDITLLGGWAVHSLVADAYALESQDIDLLIYSDKAWDACINLLIEKGGEWRIYRDRKGQSYRDHRIIFPKIPLLAVDIFYSDDVDHQMLRDLFATNWANGFKEQKYISFVPDLETIIIDKFKTILNRRDLIKEIKDILDIHALIFHNKEGKGIDEIWSSGVEEYAKLALNKIESLLSDKRCTREVQEILDVIGKLINKQEN
jgi:hypothetical protein